MRTGEVTANSSKRLKGSFCAAVSLCFLVAVSYMGFLVTGKLITVFFDTLLFRTGDGQAVSVSSVAGTMVTLGLSLAVLSPFRLNIKAWYQRLDGEYQPLRDAFTVFTGFRRYCTALWFTLVRYGAVFLTFLVPLIPSLVIAAVLRVALERGGQELGPLSGIFLVLFLLLTLLSLLFSLYMAMGYFFTDYLYVLGRERNPFRALRVSWRLMRGERPQLLRLFLRLLPYYLLCLLIVPAPFAIPNIRCALAVFAAGKIEG